MLFIYLLKRTSLLQKWERENNSLPSSQRRPKPQKPTVSIEHNDWNAAAWEQSQVDPPLQF